MRPPARIGTFSVAGPGPSWLVRVRWVARARLWWMVPIAAGFGMLALVVGAVRFAVLLVGARWGDATLQGVAGCCALLAGVFTASIGFGERWGKPQ